MRPDGSKGLLQGGIVVVTVLALLMGGDVDSDAVPGAVVLLTLPYLVSVQRTPARLDGFFVGAVCGPRPVLLSGCVGARARPMPESGERTQRW